MTSSSSSASLIASIDDILTQILVRLPLKSYTRFKSVSKHWQSLILLNPNPNPASGIIFQFCPDNIYENATKPLSAHVISFNVTKPIKFPKHPHETKILSSCNGLLLCSYPPFANNYIFNPTTNSHSSLPRNFFGNEHAICATILAFDPPHDYKVVCVRRTNSPYHYQLEIYSSETRLWRKPGNPFFAEHVDFEDGVYWNGAIHWVGLTKNGKSFYFNPDHDRQPRKMPSPPVLYLDGYMRDRYFGESRGHLHFVQVHKWVWYRAPDLSSNNCVCEKRTSYVERDFDVYEMRRDCYEWFVRYRVDASCVVVSGVECVSIRSVVRGGEKDEDEDEDSFLVVVMDKRVVRYNLVHGNCETMISEFVDFPLHPDVSVQFPYVEELICPV